MSDITHRLRESGSRSEIELSEDREEAADEIERLRAGLKNIVDSYDARSELFTCDADCAANLADHARHAIKETKSDE